MPVSWITKHKYGHAILFATLTLAFAAFPVAGKSDSLDVLVSLLTLLTMVAGARAGIESRALLWAAVATGLLGQALFTAGSVREEPWLAAVGLLMRFSFFISVILGIARTIIRSERVTMNIVFGACNVYFLMAIAWGSVYTLIEVLSPGSFTSNHGNVVMTGAQPGGELFYFSMITLTTVGYGDITPTSLTAGTIAALEGFIGQLYLAIVIARIVAMELSSRQSDPR
jgi:hypothetical protein